MFEIEELTQNGWRQELLVNDSRDAFWIARKKCDQKRHPYRVSDQKKQTICILTAGDARTIKIDHELVS